MDSYSRNSEEWKVLRRIQADEAHNCVLIGELLKRAGQDYSHATGEFYDKAVAVKGNRQRVEFLIQGLRWAVQRFEESLPGLTSAAGDVINTTPESPLRGKAACEDVLQV